MLKACGITPGHLAESFEMLAEAWARRLHRSDNLPVEAVLQARVAAMDETAT